MTSDAGVGKTWLLLSLALCIATEQPWLGRFKTRHVPVLYCDFDNHKRGDAIRRRLLKLVTAMDILPPYEEFEHNSITLLTRHDMPSAFNLYKKDGLDVLKADIVRQDYGLVIVDTFVSVHGAQSENDASQMGTVMNNLRALAADTNAAFLISHHSRKPGANADDSESRVSYRGSTAIKGGADAMLELAAEKAGILRARHSKYRHVEQLKDFAVSIKDTGDGGTEVRAEDESQLTAGRKDLVKGWLMSDLWKLDSLPLETGGWLAQARITERAQKLCIGSLNVVREGLHELKDLGKLEVKTARDLGLKGLAKYWRRVKDGGIFDAVDLPFEPGK